MADDKDAQEIFLKGDVVMKIRINSKTTEVLASWASFGKYDPEGIWYLNDPDNPIILKMDEDDVWILDSINL